MFCSLKGFVPPGNALSSPIHPQNIAQSTVFLHVIGVCALDAADRLPQMLPGSAKTAWLGHSGAEEFGGCYLLEAKGLGRVTSFPQDRLAWRTARLHTPRNKKRTVERFYCSEFTVHHRPDLRRTVDSYASHAGFLADGSTRTVPFPACRPVGGFRRERPLPNYSSGSAPDLHRFLF